ncbi:MAG: ribonuclease E activity regulator RraA [Comamonas sp.]
MQVKTSDLCDRLGPAARVCRANWQSYGGRHAASGRIQTLRTYEDAALIRTTLTGPGEGRVLVVDAGASLRVAVLGDNMARMALENGWAGLIIHGAVRDVQVLACLGIAIFALGHTPLRAGRSGLGEIGVTLSMAGNLIRPGAFIAADRDGVVVADDDIA